MYNQEKERYTVNMQFKTYLNKMAEIMRLVLAYVAAWARTITPPAQRLGLRGESDAIVDRCVS